jgi:hypothetical protein
LWHSDTEAISDDKLKAFVKLFDLDIDNLLKVCACVRACVRASVRACGWVGGWVSGGVGTHAN